MRQLGFREGACTRVAENQSLSRGKRHFSARLKIERKVKITGKHFCVDRTSRDSCLRDNVCFVLIKTFVHLPTISRSLTVKCGIADLHNSFDVGFSRWSQKHRICAVERWSNRCQSQRQSEFWFIFHCEGLSLNVDGVSQKVKISLRHGTEEKNFFTLLECTNQASKISAFLDIKKSFLSDGSKERRVVESGHSKPIHSRKAEIFDFWLLHSVTNSALGWVKQFFLAKQPFFL